MVLKDIRILVVDDMSSMRVRGKNILTQMGFIHILEANNGRLAFETLIDQQKKSEPIHLILSDWNMPEMLGIDFLKKVRATESVKTLPFVMITAEGSASQVKDALTAGVTNYLVKPFTPESFQEKVHSVINKHIITN